MTRLTTDIWSDIACPWCYVGKRRFEAALGRFEHADEVTVRWRSFELDPSAPRVLPKDLDYAGRLAAKYRTSRSQAEGMIAQMTQTAAVEGVAMRFDIIRPGNTFDAHRLLHLAHERGVQDALEERFFRAYLCEGEAIGEQETVARLAIQVGLDADEVRAVLDGDGYAEAVRQDERDAAENGIRGVPFFVLSGKYAISGAQDAETIARFLDRVWAKLPKV